MGAERRPVLQWRQHQHHWPGLQALGNVEAERRIGATQTREVRYFRLSQPMDAATFGAAVRHHWGIESQGHWVLDMSFRDESRMRDGYAAENLTVLGHLALNRLRQPPASDRLSLKARRRRAGWDPADLQHLLTRPSMRWPCYSPYDAQ